MGWKEMENAVLPKEGKQGKQGMSANATTAAARGPAPGTRTPARDRCIEHGRQFRLVEGFFRHIPVEKRLLGDGKSFGRIHRLQVFVILTRPARTGFALLGRRHRWSDAHSL